MISSAAFFPTTRAKIIRTPSPTFASPASTRRKYVRANPDFAARVRWDIPISARAATRFRPSAKLSSCGTVSASAAEGISDDRFTFTKSWIQRIAMDQCLSMPDPSHANAW